jgi:hypothetical protein
MVRWYKALNSDGTSGQGRPPQFVGKLPKAESPGPWVVVEGELTINLNGLVGDNGIHLANARWIVRHLCDEIYLAESNGETLRLGRFVVARRVRLVRRFDKWGSQTARIFAADCASRVLRIFKAHAPNDDRPRNAILTARGFANGAASEEDLDQAAQDAMAAWDSVQNVPRVNSAALAAATCADAFLSYGALARDTAQTSVAAIRPRQRHKEQRWQSRRLFEILR